MKNILFLLILLLSASSFAQTVNGELQVCHTRDIIIDGLNDGLYVNVINDEHPAENYHSPLMCYTNGESYLELTTHHKDELYQHRIHVEDDVCKALKELMNNETRLVDYVFKGRSVFSLTIEDNELVSAKKTKEKCRRVE